MLKSFFKASLLIMFVLPLGLTAQDNFANQLVSLMQTASADSLTGLLEDNITLAILDDENQVDKATAMKQLDVFFTENPIKSFKYKHGGQSKDGNTFIICHYQSENANFRTYFVVKDKKIEELCIEED